MTTGEISFIIICALLAGIFLLKIFSKQILAYNFKRKLARNKVLNPETISEIDSDIKKMQTQKVVPKNNVPKERITEARHSRVWGMAEKVIFSVRGLKWRRREELSDEEQADFWYRGYQTFYFKNIQVIARNKKRALQAE